MPNPSTAEYWLRRLRPANYDPGNYLHNPTAENFEAWKRRNQATLESPPKTALQLFQEELEQERLEAHAAGFDLTSWQLDKTVLEYAEANDCSYGEAITALNISL